MFVVGSTEGLCSFRQWGNVGLPLCIFCLDPIFPTGFPTPSSLPLTSAGDLFAQTLSGPVFLYLAGFCRAYNGHYVPYLHLVTHLIGKTGNQAASGVPYPLTWMIYSLSCSLPWHLSFLHSLQQGLMPSKCLSGPIT